VAAIIFQLTARPGKKAGSTCARSLRIRIHGDDRAAFVKTQSEIAPQNPLEIPPVLLRQGTVEAEVLWHRLACHLVDTFRPDKVNGVTGYTATEKNQGKDDPECEQGASTAPAFGARILSKINVVLIFS
jgi:hypothetical protein